MSVADRSASPPAAGDHQLVVVGALAMRGAGYLGRMRSSLPIVAASPWLR